jgi:ATP-dependent Clp protease ATP-binding subunit ClpA
MPNKMERFTQGARRVLSLAEEEAQRLQHSYIGTEHLLLGLMRESNGIAGRVLRDLGLEQRRVEELVERMTRASPRTTDKPIELSPGTKKVLELAVDEARRMSHNYIGTEHLLLGLVRQTAGVGIDVLKRLGISPEEIRRQTKRVLQESPVQPPLPQSWTEASQGATVTSAANPLPQDPPRPHVISSLADPMLLRLVGEGKVTAEQSLEMLREMKAHNIVVVQLRILDLLEQGKVNAAEAAALLKGLQTIDLTLNPREDKLGKLQITVTVGGTARDITLTPEQLHEISLMVNASIQTGRKGKIYDHQWHDVHITVTYSGTDETSESPKAET